MRIALAQINNTVGDPEGKLPDQPSGTLGGIPEMPFRALVSAPTEALLKSEYMPRLLTAEDIIPLVASLTERERARLLRLIAAPRGSDSSAYAAVPPRREEFTTDDEPLCWEAEGWEQFG